MDTLQERMLEAFAGDLDIDLDLDASDLQIDPLETNLDLDLDLNAHTFQSSVDSKRLTEPKSRAKGCSNDLGEAQDPGHGSDSTDCYSHEETAKAAKEKPAESANAVRLRRHRLKKKKEKQEMERENAALKRDRTEYLKQIADLEFEVETLRVRGVLDLTKENALIKAEIKKHKMFIDRVVSVTLNTPNEADEVEKIRVLHNAVESGARHMNGLAYASHSSDLWHEANPFALRLTADLVLPHVRVWYQYLPVDAPVKDAKRMNVRLEMGDLPVEFRTLARAYWKVTSSLELVQEQIHKGAKSNVPPMEAEVTVPAQRLPTGEEVAGFCLKNKGCDDAVSLFLSAYREDVLYSVAIPDGGAVEATDDGQEMAMVFNTAFDPFPKAVADEIECVQDLHVDGYMFRKSPSGGTSITFTQSVPLSGPLFDFIIDGVLQKRQMISNEGTVHPMLQYIHEDRFRAALAFC